MTSTTVQLQMIGGVEAHELFGPMEREDLAAARIGVEQVGDLGRGAGRFVARRWTGWRPSGRAASKPDSAPALREVKRSEH
jgi:hypothetical protein